MSDILTGTPPDLTYANDLVRQAWMVVWAITSGALVVILGWMGLSFIVAEHLGTRQAGWRASRPAAARHGADEGRGWRVHGRVTDVEHRTNRHDQAEQLARR